MAVPQFLQQIALPNEGIQHKQEDTKVFVDGNEVGIGTLCIAESALSWTNSTGQGLTLQYPQVSLHAITRDVRSFQEPSLFMMLDFKLGHDDAGEDDGSGDDAESPVSEVRFVPRDNAALEGMYEAMNTCQALHPDPNDSASEDSENEFYDEAAGGDHLTEDGQAALDHLEGLLVRTEDENAMEEEPRVGNRSEHCNGVNRVPEESMETGQFEDAEMD